MTRICRAQAAARAEAEAKAQWERLASVLAAQEVELARVQAEVNAQWLEAQRLEADRQMWLYLMWQGQNSVVFLPRGPRR